MQSYARVVDGIVAELWPHEPGAPMPTPQPKPSEVFGPILGAAFIPCGGEVRQGWTYDGQIFAAPAPVVPVIPVPEVISDRQCFQQLAVMTKITQDEALAAVTTGALPKAVSDGIAALPAEGQFPARMLICGATEFHRSHPMVPVFLGFFGLGEADRDPLWTAAAAL